MQKSYVVTGTLTDNRTVALDEALPLTTTKVRVVVEPVPAQRQRPFAEVIAEIRTSQAARGYQPPTAEEVDAYIRAERESWDD